MSLATQTPVVEDAYPMRRLDGRERAGAVQAATDRPRLGRWRAASLVAIVGLLIGAHLLTLHQGPRWTSPLLLGDWLFTVAFAVALLLYATALGRAAARPLLGLDNDWVEDVTALGLGLGMLFTAVLCLGFLHLYYGPVFLALWAALTVVLRRELWALGARVSAAPARWVRRGMPTAPSLWQRLVLVLVAVSLLHLPLRTMLPVSDWDAVAYHLAAPRLYLGLHSIVALPDLPLANAPSGLEMLYMVGLLAGTDGLGKVLMVLFSLLLALVTFALARRLCHGAAGWIAVLSLLGTLWLVAVMPLTLTDGVGAFLLVLGVYETCRWAEERTSVAAGERGLVRLGRADRRLMRAALLVGLAACCKQTNLPGIPALVATVGLVGLGPAVGPPGLRLIVAARDAAISGSLAMAPLVPWLLKNLAFFGDAFYPSRVAVSNPSHGTEIVSAPVSTGGHLGWLIQSLGDFLCNHVSYLCVVLVLAPLALRGPGGRTVLLFLGSGLLLWLLFVPYYEPPRYYLGLAALAQAAAAATAYRIAGDLCSKVRRGGTWAALLGHSALLDGVLSAYLFLRGLPLLFVGLHLLTDPALLQVARGDISRYAWLSQHVRPYLAEQWANDHAAPGPRVVLVNVLPGYYMERPYLQDWYGQRFARLQGGRAGIATELALWCGKGVGYAIFDRGDGSPDIHPGAPVTPLDGFAWVHTPGLAPRVLFSANGVDVLSIAPCRPGSPVVARSMALPSIGRRIGGVASAGDTALHGARHASAPGRPDAHGAASPEFGRESMA